jgi:PilZ domain-containing protein
MGELPERRRFPRYPCTGAAEISQNGRILAWGTVSDIGRCGCYIEIVSPLPPVTEVELRISMADILLDIQARVACATPLVGMGVEFMAASQEQERVIAQIIEKVAVVRPSLTLQADGRLQPGNATVYIPSEAETNIFARILKRIDEKGILTKEELIEMVKHQAMI